MTFFDRLRNRSNAQSVTDREINQLFDDEKARAKLREASNRIGPVGRIGNSNKKRQYGQD